MASPLPLVCRSHGPEPLRLASAPRRRPASRLPLAMLMRGLAVVAALGMPVAAATLADLVHPTAVAR
ncbi:hypothetical protein [Methylobacterium platani]|uniref:Uncharacterized protein n=2 Tax=Methylobacterium platani TaxID=427683 RepID=A0A179S0A5_9HYPH|nr:hypothetical protein [Methylobacterium platani]KMO10083.1 hypothetical protein SQ03_31075 [Methylobacterium platani JCM 14648]OAS13879.1 hypothetical protein A5481_30930 [Methylobacterium platani]